MHTHIHSHIHTYTHTHTHTHTHARHTHTDTHTHTGPKNSVEHFPVRWNGIEFGFSFGKLSTIEDLLDDFESKPVIVGESGKSGDTKCCLLRTYYTIT